MGVSQDPDGPDQAGPGPAAAVWKSFSTAQIPAGMRVEHWEEHNTKALIGLDIRTLEGGTLQAEEFNLYFPSLRFASVRGSSQIVERSQRLIAQHPTGDIAIFFALGGEAFFYHAEGMLLLRRGQAVLYDADLPFVRGFSHGVREFVLTLPREEFMRLSHGAPLREPLVFDFAVGDGGAVGDAAAGSLASLIDQVFIHPPSDLVSVEQQAFGLLEQLVARALGTDRHSAHRRAIQAIERGFCHAGLTRARVARAAGVSERQLARLFAQQGQTFAEVLMSHRLRRAETMLVSGEPASIADIARQCGFATASSFSRAFKAYAGVTPSEVQRAAAAQRD
ncbi:helix-turn-helix transcriptional regulator [Citricoccus nitrophenolicus]|uniref:helix-turn-helix transcriptional regulator n=1 Tax=Citricoccus nitrophenolicus TaxID=863575 RepID=UPI0031EB2868